MRIETKAEERCAGRIEEIALPTPYRPGPTTPEFHRSIWVSDQARTVWEHRVVRIQKSWSETEWLSVALGVRRCALQYVRLEELADYAQRLSKRGLKAGPVLIQQGDGFAGQATGATGGPENLFVRVAVGRQKDLRDFRDAWCRRDDEAMGALLGFPCCCRDFFRLAFVRDRWRDLTLAMAWNTVRPKGETTSIEIVVPAELNLFWRSMGVRAVPHLPCRFDCQPSLEFSRAFAEVGRAAGYESEFKWMLEMLSWPAQWSALHGIAEIKTPVMKIVTTTDATRKKYAIRRLGTTYPEEGAHGLTFPYQLLRVGFH